MKKRYLLAAVNAKYIHSNLAVYCLRSFAAAKGYQTEIAEYTINQQMEEMLKDLYERQAGVTAFSCYIWNIEMVCRLVRNYKKVCPQTEIWLGGPEVSYRAKELLHELPEVKGVMVGEGEETYASLLAYHETKDTDGELGLETIKGIVYRAENGEIKEQLPGIVPDFARLPFPYGNGEESAEGALDLSTWDNRILYYESSRGCPFSCSYCLSSIEKRVRFRDMELVKKELDFFLAKKVPQVKFIDRTFNCNKQRTMELWTYLKEHDNGVTNFHFEIAAELLTEEEVELLKTLRPGLVKLEIGVQSTNEQTLHAVHRSAELSVLKKRAAEVIQNGNVHVHLDLIAGLPHEDLASFQNSFHEVFSLFPHELQLGFLKVLSGSPIADEVEKQEILYSSEAPYEVLSTKWLSFADILKLKAVCEMLEVYYNSGQFTTGVRYLLHFFPNSFEFFDRLAMFYKEWGYEGKSHSRRARYDILEEFGQKILPGKTECEIFRELLVYDMCLRERLKSRPEYGKKGQMDRQELKDCYEQLGVTREAEGLHHLEKFSFDPEKTAGAGKPAGEACIVLFSYEKREPMYGQAEVKKIDIK